MKSISTSTNKNDTCTHCNLAQICLPKDLRGQDLTSISQLIERREHLQAGHVLCHAGQSFHSLHILRNGSAKDSLFTINGNEQITDFYLPGEIIGLESISTGKHLYDTIILEPSEICVISYAKLLSLSYKIPQLHYRITYLTSQKLTHRTRVLVTHHHSAEQRIAAFLMNISYRYKSRGEVADNYHLSMSRHDIGSYLNLTTETVSRMFTKLQDEGVLIANKKHIQLINSEKLINKYLANQTPFNL